MLWDMPANQEPIGAPRDHEALISLTALHYIEENELLDTGQLADAKKSLQALFLRTSGEETMLRRLIDVLKVTRNIQSTFTNISGTIGAVRKSVATVDERVANLRQLIEHGPVSPEHHAAFAGPFLAFSNSFVQKIHAFEETLQQYLDAREQEASAQNIYRIARDSRERLRQRLSGKLAQGSGDVETRIKDELATSFNYGDAEEGMRDTTARARAVEKELQDQLSEIRTMCQAAMNPSMRNLQVAVKEEDDMYLRFAGVVSRDATLDFLKAPVQELLKLYQHAHGMFQLDYDKLKHALQTLVDSTDAYFHAKDEDRDVTAKREKLRKIEGLIPFLEHGAQLAQSKELEIYDRFSRELGAAISQARAPWSHVSDDLLRAKVQAEAELSTRL
jgi:hypothetical protein